MQGQNTETVLLPGYILLTSTSKATDTPGM